jgi:hypothetical protein
MAKDLKNDVTDRIVSFLTAIGLSVSESAVPESTFLGGIEVVGGALQFDRDKLGFPGDLLHEAGHLAVTPASERPMLSGEVETLADVPELIELEAMLWSYAACLHLGLDPRVVFHAEGYHGQSEALLRNFSMGIFLGVNGLEKAGMTLSPAEAAQRGKKPFPSMQKWLKD